jgi:hypothetical protein
VARFPFQTSLDEAQQNLLLSLVDAQESLPRDGRQPFLLSQTMAGETIVHPGITQIRAMYYSDLVEIEHEGLIRIEIAARNHVRFDVTNRGYLAAREIRSSRGSGIQQVESEVFRYVSSGGFAQRHSAAATKLRSAEEALIKAEIEPSAIGHFCREAFQEFAHGITEDADPTRKAQTKNRIRAAIATRRPDIGDRHIAWLEALTTYTLTVIDLAQRQEHLGTAEGEPDPEDARIVVFQTAVALYELDRALRPTRPS